MYKWEQSSWPDIPEDTESIKHYQPAETHGNGANFASRMRQYRALVAQAKPFDQTTVSVLSLGILKDGQDTKP